MTTTGYGGHPSLKGGLAGTLGLLLASLGGVLLTALTNLLLVKVLSAPDYGRWGLFILYTGYVGALHCGLPDGALVAWAGGSWEEHRAEIAPAFGFFLAQQLAVVAPLALLLAALPAGWVGGRGLWGALLAYALLFNVLTFSQFALQSFGRFTPLALSLCLPQAALFAATLPLAARGRLTCGSVLVALLMATGLAVIVATRPVLAWCDRATFSRARAWAIGRRLTRAGALYLAGNFLLLLVFGLDRLAAARAFSPAVFAPYALASLVTGTLYVGLGAATAVLLPLLARRDRAHLARAYTSLRSVIILTWGLALAAYFPAAALIGAFLPHYAASLPPLRLLLVSTGAGAVIRSAHYTYYRIARRQVAYLVTGAGAAIATLGLLVAVRLTAGGLTAYAGVAVVATALWAGVNEAVLRGYIDRVGSGLVRPGGAWLAFAATFLALSGLPLPPWPALSAYLLAAVAIATAAFHPLLRAMIGAVRERAAGPASPGFGAARDRARRGLRRRCPLVPGGRGRADATTAPPRRDPWRGRPHVVAAGHTAHTVAIAPGHRSDGSGGAADGGLAASAAPPLGGGGAVGRARQGPTIQAGGGTGRPRVAVVILNWNGWADTRRCLDALGRDRADWWRAVVVDNASTDGSWAALRAYADPRPWITPLAAGGNRGFAGGHNVGIRRALAEGVDIVVLLNNDALFVPGGLARLVAAFAGRPELGQVGPIVTYRDAPDTVWWAGGVYHAWANVTRHPGMRRPVTPRRSGPTGYVSGCAVAVSRAALETAGLLDEGFFLNFEDVDWSLRIRRADWAVELLAEPLVHHAVSASQGEGGATSATQLYYYCRNPFLLTRRHATGLRRLAHRCGFLAIDLPHQLVRVARAPGRRRALLDACWAGVRDGSRGVEGPRPTP